MEETNAYLLIMKLIFYLTIILLLIYFFFKFLSKRTGFQNRGIYQHLGSLSLGQNKSIQAIEIGKKIYILGVSQEINPIKIIDDEEEIFLIKSSVEANSQQSNDILQSMLKTPIFKKIKELHKSRTKKKESPFENLLSEKMEQMKEKRVYSIDQWLELNNEQEKSDKNE